MLRESSHFHWRSNGRNLKVQARYSTQVAKDANTLSIPPLAKQSANWIASGIGLKDTSTYNIFWSGYRSASHIAKWRRIPEYGDDSPENDDVRHNTFNITISLRNKQKSAKDLPKGGAAPTLK